MYGKKRNQIGILELENTITKVKISLQVFNSVLEDAEERISKLKDRTIKVSSLRSRKKEKKSEQSLRDCGMQLSKPIHVVWIYEKEKRERSRSMYLQINGWKRPKFEWRHESTHLRKKERIMKAAGEKWLIIYKKTSVRLMVDFFIRNHGGQKAVGWYI